MSVNSIFNSLSAIAIAVRLALWSSLVFTHRVDVLLIFVKPSRFKK